VRNAAHLFAVLLLVVAGCRDKQGPGPIPSQEGEKSTKAPPEPVWHEVTKPEPDAKDGKPKLPPSSPKEFERTTPVKLPGPAPEDLESQVIATLVKVSVGVALVWARPLEGDETEILWQKFDEYKGLVGSPRRVRITNGSVRMIVASGELGENRIAWCSRRASPDTIIYGMAWLDDLGDQPYPAQSIAVLKTPDIKAGTGSSWKQDCHLAIQGKGEGILIMRQNGVVRDAVEEGSAEKEWRPAYVLEEIQPSEPANCIDRGSSYFADQPGPLVTTNGGLAYEPGRAGFTGSAIIVEEGSQATCSDPPCETFLANAFPRVLAWTGEELVVIGTSGKELVLGAWQHGESTVNLKRDEQTEADISLPKIQKSELVCATAGLTVILHVDGGPVVIHDTHESSIPWTQLLSVLGFGEYTSVLLEDDSVYILSGASILYGECKDDGLEMKKIDGVPSPSGQPQT